MVFSKFSTRSLPLLLLLAAIASSLCLWQCKSDVKSTTPTEVPEKKKVTVPPFNADTAYQYVAHQVAFGPRVLGSPGHSAMKNWLVDELKSLGATVIVQDFTAKVYTGSSFPASNIIAQFNPQATYRIMFSAHWDTRHIADSPLNTERVTEPILGADDGGSGVAVLLEIARQLKANPVEIGIDLVFFDAEDYGNSTAEGAGDTYCLGSQHWARNLPTPHKPRYGILLDMVGAKGARFTMEGYSNYFAPDILNKVWTLAANMGKGNYFVKQQGPGITDDHYYVNSLANIPTIDIINLAGTDQTSFGAHWHTHNDDMGIIDRATLGAVGQVLLAVIYREDGGQF